MRPTFLLTLFFSMMNLAQADFVIPSDIANGFVQSSIGEDNGLYIQGVDEEIFIIYFKENWKSIVNNVERLPFHPHENEKESEVSLTSLSIFVLACENLPPLEYLDYLDSMLVLFVEKKIDITALSLVLGRGKKQDFLSVNWEHPRVRVILAKAKQLIPPSDVDLLSCIDDMASGALADNYRTNVSEEVPNPETLPGIKLKRPWDSLIKKYERMTGKKLEEPHDPQLNPRPERRNETFNYPTPALAKTSPSVTKKQWIICGLLLLITAFAARMIHKRKV